MDGGEVLEVGAQKALAVGKLAPLEISLTWAYCLTRLLWGLLSLQFAGPAPN